MSQPDTGEQALEICDTLVRSGAIDLVVIDSVAALVPRAEIEGEMGDSHVGLQAGWWARPCARWPARAEQHQHDRHLHQPAREKIGVMFSSPETTTGGKALKFYASGPPGRPSDRDPQGRYRGGRQPHPRQGRQEQGRPAVQAG
ncbi:MAG: hypothetical protein U0R65_02210 [Candidatus Nanopelagicales bacterium]